MKHMWQEYSKDEQFVLYHGSFVEIEDCPLEPASLDIIFADLPYGSKYANLLPPFALFASKFLKPDGFCLVMCGDALLHQTVCAFEDVKMEYLWTYKVVFETPPFVRVYFPVRTLNRSKLVLVYTHDKHGAWHRHKKVRYTPSDTIFVSTPREKSLHEWQQSVSMMYQLLQQFIIGDGSEIVCDPCVGTGTTGIAALDLNAKFFIGIDVDVQMLEIANERLRRFLGLKKQDLVLEVLVNEGAK